MWTRKWNTQEIVFRQSWKKLASTQDPLKRCTTIFTWPEYKAWSQCVFFFAKRLPDSAKSSTMISPGYLITNTSSTVHRVRNETIAEFRAYYFGPLWIWAGTLLAMNVIGAANNFLVILSVWRFRVLRTTPNILLVNMSIMSLIFSLVTGPIILFHVLTRSLYDTPKIPNNFCRYFNYFQHGTVFNLALAICALSIKRCIAVVFPQFYRRISLKTALLFFALPPWLIPWFFGLFGVTEFAGRYAALPPFGYCVPASTLLIMLIQTFFVYVPTAIMTLCYCAIVLKLMFLGKRTGPPNVTMAPTRLLIRKRAMASRKIFSCFVMFVCAYYPTSVLYAIEEDSPKNHPVLFLWLRSLAFTMPLMNPVTSTWASAAAELYKASGDLAVAETTVFWKKQKNSSAHGVYSRVSHFWTVTWLDFYRVVCHSLRFKSLNDPCGVTVEIESCDLPDRRHSTVFVFFWKKSRNNWN